MKILYHHRIRSKDGQFVHLEELVHAFEHNGHEVILVGPEILNSSDFGSDSGFTDVLRKWLPQWLYEFLELGYCVPAFFRLLKSAKANKPDFIYERYNWFFPVGVAVSKLLRIPLVLEVNGPLYEERSEHGGLSLLTIARLSQEITWRGAGLILPVTEVLADYLRKAGVDPDRILVVPNGVDEQTFAKADGNLVRESLGLKEKLILGFTGFVRPWHGVNRIIDAIAQGKLGPDCVLLLVGDGPILPALKEQAKSLGIEDRVIFTGLVGRSEIPNYVASFDIALQPAVVAWASPLKMIEYFACGRPVVAPTQPNIMELISDGHNGLLFDPQDPEGQVRAIAALVADPELRKSIGIGSRKTISRLNLTWLSNADRIVDSVNTNFIRRN